MLEPMGLAKRKEYPQQQLAARLVDAMQDAKLSLADLARACGVTIQAVYAWRETGRIGKQHLFTICQMTKKPLEYFLVGLRSVALVALVAAAPQQDARAAAISHNSFCAGVASVIHIASMRWRVTAARLFRWLLSFRIVLSST